MKFVSIVGARPQFVKASVLSRALRLRHEEVLVHTGQHYDDNMSDVFFQELDIPRPAYHLDVGSGLHGAQTAAMMVRIEGVLDKEKPDRVLVYGDTNSTLAGALVAAKMRIPLVHVEAGLRSFNRAMPEEINRIMADHLSDVLLCPSRTAVENLRHEGILRGVHLVGDVMYEALMHAVGRKSDVIARLGLKENEYLLATVHRAENTDNPERLKTILAALSELAASERVILPVHPRTRAVLKNAGIAVQAPGLELIGPLGYLDMAKMERTARMILTDSGGVQKEAYWLGVPCITLRNETEWVETVETGWNVLAGASTADIVRAVKKFREPLRHPSLYGDSRVTESCVKILEGALME